MAHNQVQNAHATENDGVDGGDSESCSRQMKRQQRPTPTDAEISSQPPHKKMKMSHGTDGDQNSDDVDADEHGGDSEGCTAAWTWVKEQSCLQRFVNGPGCLKRKRSITYRVPFEYYFVEQYVAKYTQRREETVRAIRNACTRFPSDIVTLIADAASPKAVHSVDEALPRSGFELFMSLNHIDDFYECDDEHFFWPVWDWGGSGFEIQNTRLIDINATYETLCGQYGFRSALVTAPQLWSRVLHDFQVKHCKESQCPQCTVDILPRSNSQKWLLLQERREGHGETCDEGTGEGTKWCVERGAFEMLVIECFVNQSDGRVSLRSANHGTFQVSPEEESRRMNDRSTPKAACDVLCWFSEFSLKYGHTI